MLKPQNKNNRTLKKESVQRMRKKWWDLPSIRAEVKDAKERQSYKVEEITIKADKKR